MLRTSLVAFALLLATAEAGAQVSQVQTFCGPEPRQDPSKTAEVTRAQRLVDRVIETRAKVFSGYRIQYDRDRARIIDRNKRLPRAQHLPVPPAMSDEELRASKEYRERIARAHADDADEAKARAQLDKAQSALDQAQASYDQCKARILERMRTAPQKEADDIRAIPRDKRLSEEQARFMQLKEAHMAAMEAQRTDPKRVVPILTAAICAHQAREDQLDREARALRKEQKKSGVDRSGDIADIDEKKDSHHLEVIELKRDLKLLKARQGRCSKGNQLAGCIEAHLLSPNALPAVCKPYTVELEIIGYVKQSWD